MSEKKKTPSQESKPQTPSRPPSPPSSSSSLLLEPVASDERLVETFRRYVELKEKILEETDYTWFAVWRIMDDNRKKGFKNRKEAEKAIEEIRGRGAQADLEKKIKKSGCLKLGKAFGISTSIIGETITPDAVTYKVRAKAPNEQFGERTGSCDRKERGKKDVPFDHLDSIALTRATNRAIMALLGGENTAEEFEEIPVEEKRPEGKTPEEVSEEFNREFEKKAPAKPTTLETLRGRMLGLAQEAKLTPDYLKKAILIQFGVTSTKVMTEAQINETIEALEKKIVGF